MSVGLCPSTPLSFYLTLLLTFLFQSLIMMKGLMDRCINREMALERVRAKAEQTKDELGQLNKWKSTMEKKFDLSE